MMIERNTVGKTILLIALLFCITVVAANLTPRASVKDDGKDFFSIDTARERSTINLYILEQKLKPYELKRRDKK